MGSGESTTRKVSFGVDDEDRVRILRGVKLSEDVLQRMRGVANIAPGRTPSANSSAQKDTGASGSASSSPQPPQSSQRRAQPSTPPNPPPSTPSNTSKPETKDDQRRFEKKQTIHKEELAKKAQKEREAARQEMTKAMTRERQHTRQEAEKAKQLAQKLQKKDAQLTALDAFYKEQLAQLEKRNLERYEQSKDQFHQAASKTEEHVRSRNTDPVCLGLQTQILSCYKDNGDQTLKCSDLAKTYMQCINAAKKNLQVNHG
ncbi:MICOS complex subunit mic25a isoform X2 [Hippoglossus hippoglossus]|uniref:MICOS complex subunit mic25a isoform X2 n=1 Tax=Hippoglossus hippoglossus TaxID=8267 RepID=UPI00148D8613|nr:MICOS complex subunit mic25a isoform X2 [Hippoglossus hippoglossus]XP_035015674.1 MICOS complex subunit mic25a isoform X2 [Hippoglossus stenolepis]